jgi:hypothetical protein
MLILPAAGFALFTEKFYFASAVYTPSPGMHFLPETYFLLQKGGVPENSGKFFRVVGQKPAIRCLHLA